LALDWANLGKAGAELWVSAIEVNMLGFRG
jgi:hypothetical protein